MPSDDSFSVRIEYGALEPYRIDSEFWDLYEKSESTGEVLECEDLKENLINQGLPQVYYCNAGTIMRREDFSEPENGVP